MQDIRPNHRRAAHQSKPAGRAHAPLRLHRATSASNWLPFADFHLAPKASTDRLSIRSATQNRTKAARRQSTQCQCPCNVPLCPSREHVHNMASPRSSHHCSMPNDTSMRMVRFAGATTNCEVSSRTIRTSKAENTFTSCPSGLDRPSSKLSMSSCWWPHDWWLNNLSSSGS